MRIGPGLQLRRRPRAINRPVLPSRVLDVARPIDDATGRPRRVQRGFGRTSVESGRARCPGRGDRGAGQHLRHAHLPGPADVTEEVARHHPPLPIAASSEVSSLGHSRFKWDSEYVLLAIRRNLKAHPKTHQKLGSCHTALARRDRSPRALDPPNAEIR